MDFLMLAVIGISTIIMTKALEKTGEKLGENLFEQTGKLISLLQKKFPKSLANIRKLSENPSENPSDYNQLVLEIERLAKLDPEIAEELKTLVELANKEENQKLNEIIQTIKTTLKSQTQQSNTEKISKIADKIGVVVQGGTNQFGDIKF